MKAQGLGALQEVLADLQSPGVWLELGALFLCIAVAYGFTRWLAYVLAKSAVPTRTDVDAGPPSQEVHDSVWFGRRILDGLLFPGLALALVYMAFRLLDGFYPQVAILTVAVPMLVSLTVIRFFARVLTGVFPGSGAARLLERGVSWLAWGAAVLWILGLLPGILAELDAIRFSFGKTTISVRMIIEGLLSSTVVLMLALWLAGGIEKRVLNHAVSDLSMRKAAVNAVRALLLGLGLLVALSAVGVDLTALSVLGGALGVGLGFGLQKLAANYVSGFVILLERSLRIGDMVKVDNFEGRITDIKTRYTLIRALNGRESVVPNEKIITERIENLSLADPNVAIATKITVGYDSEVAQVQAILSTAAATHPRVLSLPAPGVTLSNFSPDGLEFTLTFWIADAENGEGNVRSDIHIAMLEGLRTAKVEIPYPQRVVRMV
jgi:small-conductance mechanosensitive channel